MIKKSLETVPVVSVTMAGAEKVGMQLLAGPGDGVGNFAMRKFLVEAGGCTPRHYHDYEHEILILSGEGSAFGNGVENAIKAGDVLVIPANEVHQFRNTGSGVLEFICLVPAFVHRAGAPAAVQVDCGEEMK